MAEIWGAAIAVGGAILSAKGKKKEKEADQAYDQQMTEEGARNNARLAKFEGELADYYSQLNRARKQRGLDNIRQFSQLGRIAPEYQQVSQPIATPTAPDAEAVIPKAPEEQAAASSGSKKSTLKKILDPLGLF